MTARTSTRRHFLKALGLGAAALSAPAIAREVRPGRRRRQPNIILIMADDLGYGDVGCYGSKRFRTPNIDALAKEGMRFTDYHSNGVVCSPTRAALMTGRYQQRCGIEGVVTAANHRHTGMGLTQTTFAEVLKGAGYKTAIFGKWHLGYSVKFNPMKQGFDEFWGFVSGNVDYHSHIDQAGYVDWWKGEKLTAQKGYSTDLITEHGVRFIEQNKDVPFCLYLPHESPHYPLQGRGDKPERAKGNPRAFPKVKDGERAYKEMIEVMDEGVGRIVETVRRLNLETRTLIFFCSDNGPAAHGSAGPLRGSKGTVWEGGHRVAGIARWPSAIEPGTECDETVLGMDLFPTMANLAGATLPEGLELDGVDILPLLLGRGSLPERSLFWRAGAQRAIRKGQWKLLVNPKGGKNAKGSTVKNTAKIWLFRLDDDLGEQVNLAEKEFAKTKELLAELQAWEKEVSEGVEKRT